MIEPTPKDIGRRVKLPVFNGPDLHGQLVEVMMADLVTPEPFARVKYPDMRMPVMTDLSKLEWAD